MESNVLKNHEIADLFPMMNDQEFCDLVDDINQNGLRESIWLYQGKILDGRNRYKACIESNTKPTYRQYDGNDPVSFVVSLNLKRRHLDTAQRAMVAARIANMQQGARTDLTEISAMSQPEAAKVLNVSTDSVQFAKKILDKGSKSLIQKVDSGQIAVSTAADISSLPKEEQTEIVARGEKEILQAAKEIRSEKSKLKRKERIEKINEISKGNAELSTDVKFPVIYADPPWKYEHSNTDSRKIENQYPTMDLEDICNLQVPANNDSILFLWTTAPKLEEGLKVLNQWGFSYRSCAIWDKQKMGMGYYFRIQHEILLVGTRGNIPVPEPSCRPRSIFSIGYSGHSVKPEEVAKMIEEMYPELPKLEMFSRSNRVGWSVWGNQSAA